MSEPTICQCGLGLGQICLRQLCLRNHITKTVPQVPDTVPVFVHGAINPVGCICPPGANRDCENPACPRKAHRNVTSSGGSASV
jgi:hypothetical protein